MIILEMEIFLMAPIELLRRLAVAAGNSDSYRDFRKLAPGPLSKKPGGQTTFISPPEQGANSSLPAHYC